MTKQYQPPKSSHRQFDPHTVLYLTGNENYSHIHLTSGEVILMSYTLKWFAARWPWLLRVHKQALINPAYSKQLRRASGGRNTSYLVMCNQAQIAISRRRLPTVIKQLNPPNTYSENHS